MVLHKYDTGNLNHSTVVTRTSRESLINRILVWFKTVLVPPSVVYINPKGKISNFISSQDSEAKILDIGSGSQKRGENVVNLDIIPFSNVNIVFDGLKLPIKDEAVDALISSAVLEHVQDPTQLVSEMFRILKKGGAFLVTVPFMQGYHPIPEDFQRFTISGLDVMFSRFDKIESGIEAGPSSALAWIMREWIASFAVNKFIYRLLFNIGGWLVQPIKYFDIILAKKPYAYKTAAGFYFIGEKPSH